jgi:hypothetical protein
MMLIAAALLLLSSTVAAWFVAATARPAARVQLRFAAMLLAACGVAAVLTPVAAPAVSLLVLPIAAAVLALAAHAGFEHPVAPALASLALATVSICGIIGAATGLALFALASAMLGTLALLVLSVRRLERARMAAAQGGLAALCLLAAQSLYVLEHVSVPFLLFLSAGVLGAALALRSDLAAEEKPAPDLRAAAIGGRRLG